MIKTNSLRKIGIQTGIILFLFLISYIYFFPVLEGKVLITHDINSHLAMSKELVDFRNETGKEAIWTNSMFGGMPGFMINVFYPSNLLSNFLGWYRILFHPVAMLILYMIGFYILLKTLKNDSWISLLGAIAFGFSSYLLIIIGAGHTSKAYAIGFLLPVIAGLIMAYKGNPWKGGLLFSAALGFEILASHFQITYYGLIILFIYFIVEFIFSYREKTLPVFFKTTLILASGAMLAVAVNFSSLYTTWEYSKQTIRGPSELTSNNSNKTTGLDKDYVVQWSQGIDETFTLLVPNFKGGWHGQHPGLKSESYKALRQQSVQNPRDILTQIVLYHGEKPFTSGPFYFGALVIFLFILGLITVKGRLKWWLLSVTIISFFLSWGKNVMGLTSFLLDYLPLYNKFRVPETSLVIAGITVPLLGFIALNQILSGKTERKEFLKGLKWAFGITGGITLILAVFPGIAGDFSAPFDSGFPDWLLGPVIQDRMKLLQVDAFRSFAIIALGATGLFFWYKNKIKTNSLIVLLGFIIVVDLWMVDKRYVNKGNFESKRNAENPFPLMPADKEILRDKDLSYRVLPLQNPFQDPRASYYHKNVGGYHAAKLRRYQEIIDFHLVPEIEKMISGLNASGNIDSLFSGFPAINMLNSRYIIYDLNNPPIRNPHTLGNAWFVGGYKIVKNADEEIASINGLDPTSVALVDSRFGKFVEGKNFQKDQQGSISLAEYKPNYLKYDFSASSDQLAVFSEIYYAKGWKAYVDGKESPYFRVNYILRGMVIPQGKHTVEFRFESASYKLGNKVSLASSIIMLVLIAGFIFMELNVKIRKKE